MEVTLRALIDYSSAITEFETIEEYDNHLDQNGIKKTIPLPGLLLHFSGGHVKQHAKGMDFRLLVLTESKSFNKKENRSNNLVLVTKLMDHFSESPGFEFTDNGTQYSYEIKLDTLQAKPVLINDRHVIHTIMLNIAYIDIQPI